MRVKLLFILATFVVAGLNQVYSQTVITLSQPETGIKDHRANYNVEFKVGYHYGANTTDFLHGYIDENIIGDNPAGGIGDLAETFDGKSINTGLTVGKISGNHTITPTGSANYSIPIKLPPGTNGLSPSLSVNYSSQAGNSLLGMGWNIGGISAITRSQENIYNDNGVNPVRMSRKIFALDGNRLISSGGTTYHSEQETYNRITSQGSTGNGPSWFRVESKNGMTFEYGNTADSKFHPQNNNPEVVSWYLSKVYDNYGNYYTYHYRIEDSEMLLDEIKYGGNASAGVQAYNTVKFIYNDRQDKNTTDIGGETVKQNVVLSQIKVRSEGVLVRKYLFKYGYSLFTYLTEVTELGSDQSALNSTIFKYGTPSTEILEEQATYSKQIAAGIGQSYFPGDYDGDGKTDLLTFNYTLSNGGSNNISSWGDIELHRNDGNNQFTKISTFSPPAGFTNKNNVYPKSKGQIGNASLQSVDFNGDGKSDLLIIIPSNYNRDYTFHPYISTGTDLVAQAPFTINTFGSILTRTFDADGDGKTDIFTTYNTTANNYNYQLIFNNNLSDPKNCSGNYGTVNQVVKLFKTDDTSKPNPENVLLYPPVYIGDDSHGNPVTGPPEHYYTALQAWEDTWDFPWDPYQGPIYKIVTTGNLLPLYNFLGSYVIDYDGDGKYSLGNVSLNFIDANGFSATTNNRFFDFNGTCMAPYTNIPLLTPYDNNVFSDHLFGDFNGDRKTDLIYTNQSNSWPGWNCRYGTTNSFIEDNTNNQLSLPYYVGGQFGKVNYTADINGDGKSDIVEFVSPTMVNVHYSNGVNFLKESYSLTFPVNPEATISNGNDQLLFGDYNGDGKTDIMVQKPSDPAVYIIYFEKESKEMLLHGIKDGFNNAILFSYDYLTNDAIYTKGSGATYPVIDIQPASTVVTSVNTPNGIGAQAISNYRYEKAKMHKEGKGYLGFEKVIITDNNNGIKTTTNYEIDPTFFVTNPKTIRTELLSGGLLSLSTLEYNYKNLSNNRVYSSLKKSIVTDALTNFTTTTNYKYDLNGNPTVVNVSRGNLETINTTNVYGLKGSWLPGVLTKTTSTSTRQGAIGITRTVDYNYTPQGKLTQKTTDVGDAKMVTTSYTYNAFGNVIKTTIIGSGATTRTATNTYDPKGRYVVKTTNALNQSSFTTYDHKWGVPLTMTGIDGLVTKYTYNSFGVLISKTTPDNIKTDYILGWDVGSGGSGSATTVDNSIYTNTVNSPGSPTVKTWYDSFGRERMKEIDGFNQKIQTVIAYDNRGRVKTTTSPFFPGGSTPIITTNTYNNLNQMTTAQNSAGTTSYSYAYAQGKLTTSVINPDLTTNSKTVDATGKIIEATDAGGSLTYTYNSQGLQNEIKLNGVSVSKMKYDKQGHQTELEDKNAGTTKYKYNALGELFEQEDANGSKYEITYDVLGRILTKKDVLNNSLNTQYLYETIPEGINQLKTVTSNNISEEYKYDNLNRLIEHIETIETVNYSTKYTYDAYNNVATTEYPSGFIVENAYNQHGYLRKVVNAGTTIWQASTMNAYNQYTKYTTGNGITMNKIYDQYGLPSLFLASDNSVQDLGFSFNAKNGNLNWRNDNRINVQKQEIFEYDGSNRLTKTTIDGVVQSTMNYGLNGNISFKTDAGSYNYDGDKINAVVGIASPTSDISLMQQDVTYNHFNSPETITEDNSLLTLTYGPSEQRKKTVYNEGSINIEKYFLGNYEIVKDVTNNNETFIHYIAGGDGLTAIYTVDPNTINSGEMHYVYTDHLGSILTLTDDAGIVELDQNFDAWGRDRNPNTWDYANTTLVGNHTGFEWLTRGYTGHEHLSAFKLINMNGRVYDPIVGRMLSTDNYVQDPTNTQSYNRYSYVINNPLKYTDPSGEIWGALIQGAFTYIRGVVENGGQWNPTKWDPNTSAFIGAGVTTNGNPNGTNAYHFGSGIGGIQTKTVLNGDYTTSIPGINWGQVNMATRPSSPRNMGEILGHQFVGLGNTDINFSSNIPFNSGNSWQMSYDDAPAAGQTINFDRGEGNNLIDNIGTAIGTYAGAHQKLIETEAAKWLRYGKDATKFSGTILRAIGTGGNALNSFAIIQNARGGAYSPTNNITGPLTGTADAAFNLVGFTGVGLPATFFYFGAVKPYQSWYKNELNTNSRFLKNQLDKSTNPFYIGPGK